MRLCHLDDLASVFGGEGPARLARWIKGLGGWRALNNLALGCHVLVPGTLWLNLEEVRGRSLQEARYEAHRDFADLQFTLEGDETIAVCPLEELTPLTGWQGDLRFFEFCQPRHRFSLKDGAALWLFPGDGHAPCLGQGPIRKGVFKIRRDLFDPEDQKRFFF